MKLSCTQNNENSFVHELSINLAPIGVSTYSRAEHLRKTIEALKNNTLAKESDLYIFSDAPKAGDEEKVAAVRNYIYTISGFKSVNIIERAVNDRVANNRGGMQMLLERYGKIIFLEEDVVTAPSFLTYMNNALSIYENDKNVFAITGYCPPIDTSGISADSDVFLLPYCYFWGLGIWKSRYEQIRMTVPLSDVCKLLLNPFALNSLMNNAMDLPYMLSLDSQGKLDALDVKISYEMWRRKSYLVSPRRSLCINNGFDGTGEHCGESRTYDTELHLSSKQIFNFPFNLFPDKILFNRHTQLRACGRARIRWMVHIYREFARYIILECLAPQLRSLKTVKVFGQNDHS